MISRRGLFGLLAGAAAAPVVSKMELLSSVAIPAPAVRSGLIMEELVAVTRTAFVPKIVVQLSKPNALLAWAERSRDA